MVDPGIERAASEGLAGQGQGGLKKRSSLSLTAEKGKGRKSRVVFAEQLGGQGERLCLDILPGGVPEAGQLVLLEFLQSTLVQADYDARCLSNSDASSGDRARAPRPAIVRASRPYELLGR